MENYPKIEHCQSIHQPIQTLTGQFSLRRINAYNQTFAKYLHRPTLFSINGQISITTFPAATNWLSTHIGNLTIDKMIQIAQITNNVIAQKSQFSLIILEQTRDKVSEFPILFLVVLKSLLILVIGNAAN